MARQHDDRGERIALRLRLPNHLRQFEAIEDRHRPIRDDDIRDVVAVHFQRGCAVFGFVHLARAERMQQRPQNPTHMRIIVAYEKSKLVEIDAEHGDALGEYRSTVYPALTISRRR